LHFRRDISHRALKLYAENNEDAHITYVYAGVSINNGDLFVQKIKAMVKSIIRTGADAEIDGSVGTFELNHLVTRTQFLYYMYQVNMMLLVSVLVLLKVKIFFHMLTILRLMMLFLV
jgi:hypothetical protein